MEVRFRSPAQVSLLQHVFASILRRGLRDPGVAAGVQGAGKLGLEAGGMAITADFGTDAVVLSGGREGCRAWAGGEMNVLLDVCLTGAVIWPWIEGRLHWGGNPFALLKLLSVLAAARRAAPAVAT